MITLYQREVCPDSVIVRKWLGRHNLPYQIVSVPKLTTNRKELIALAKTGVVPVLEDGDHVICDSKNIIEYLEKNYGNAEYGDPGYGLTVNVGQQTIEEVHEKVIAAFKEQGFGLQTQMNLQETFKNKLEVDFQAYSILGFCHPQIAHQALQSEPGIGLLLPCNVVVTENPNRDIIVSAIDPMRLFSVLDRDDIKPLAKKIKEQMSEALNSI